VVSQASSIRTRRVSTAFGGRSSYIGSAHFP
jgi:hypothetical protein